MLGNQLIIIRGGGDLATGTIHRLWSAGYRILVLETKHPAAIRRQVAVSEAIYEQTAMVEGLQAECVETEAQMETVWSRGTVPIVVDPGGIWIEKLHPNVVVDAILAKKNLGTTRNMAPLTIGLGPGFTAGEDVDIVIETKRGHRLGRVIRCGEAIPNTGIPGMIGGFAVERVMHAPAAGIWNTIHQIGDIVSKETVIAKIETKEGNSIPVRASITGIIRGLLRDGYVVTEGFKVADIDPRESELENCFLISDKARCIAGSVLEVICASMSS